MNPGNLPRYRRRVSASPSFLRFGNRINHSHYSRLIRLVALKLRSAARLLPWSQITREQKRNRRGAYTVPGLKQSSPPRPWPSLVRCNEESLKQRKRNDLRNDSYSVSYCRRRLTDSSARCAFRGCVVNRCSLVCIRCTVDREMAPPVPRTRGKRRIESWATFRLIRKAMGLWL